METLYRYTGMVAVWVVIIAACLAAAFLISLVAYRIYRRSWLYGAWEILKTLYYYKWTKKRKANRDGIEWVQRDLDSKAGKWPGNPYRGWWQRFINEQRTLLNEQSNEAPKTSPA